MASVPSSKFVWRKKIERDLAQGVPIDKFSWKEEKRRQAERMAEIKKLKKRREERAGIHEKAIDPEEDKHRGAVIVERKRFPVVLEERRLLQELNSMPNIPSEDNLEKKALLTAMAAMEDEAGDAMLGSSSNEISLDSQLYWHSPRKPNYLNRIHTGYEWNKYNQTHCDSHNPPPKIVQGLRLYRDTNSMFSIPILLIKGKAPTYAIDKDCDSLETCIIRFHRGPPYQDIAFRIVNKEWQYSHKKGFKCSFDQGGILHLYFNFKCYCYRR